MFGVTPGSTSVSVLMVTRHYYVHYREPADWPSLQWQGRFLWKVWTCCMHREDVIVLKCDASHSKHALIHTANGIILMHTQSSRVQNNRWFVINEWRQAISNEQTTFQRRSLLTNNGCNPRSPITNRTQPTRAASPSPQSHKPSIDSVVCPNLMAWHWLSRSEHHIVQGLVDFALYDIQG